MIRVIIICEGETEQGFCNTILAPYFFSIGIIIQAPIIKKSMGGIVKWQEIKKQIEIHLKTEKTVYVTTFIDYYGLNKKHDFPKWEKAEREIDKNRRMEILEDGMAQSISENLRYRYLPYIQLHEFEGLLFNDINIFHEQFYIEELVGLEELEQTFQDFENPEMINNNKDTAPSKRLERIIEGYHKVVYGNILAEEIGLEKLRDKSPRFNAWLNKIEQIKK